MSVRMRSAIGAVLLCGGILLAVGAGLYRACGLAWAGLASAALGIGFIAWAFLDVNRAIGAAGREYEAKLRAELPDKREQNPPGER